MIIPSYGRTLHAEEWQPLLEPLLAAQHLVLTTHENSDGDGLGCEVALALALTALGKEVSIVNPTEVPPNYQFLRQLYPIVQFNPKSEEAIQELSLCDAVVLLDANLSDRMGTLWPHVRFARELGSLKLLCVDHHLEPNDFTDVMISESYASSTGELVYGLILAMEQSVGRALFTPNIAQALYVAVMTDTGSFRFSKTTPYVYQLAGDLVARGANPEKAYDLIFNSLTPQALKLLGLSLSAISLVEGGKLSWLLISQEMLKATESKLFDTDIIVRYLLSVPSVAIAVLLVEMQDGRTKASFRSRGKLPVNKLAKEFGGGGHMNAAGALFPYTPEKVQQVLPQAVRRFIKEHEALL
uniref:Dhh family protein n=1 Tax=Chlorobium chlorochromatii (strain CaD3) TaxID=340177 RepID=Q3ASD5_CHLCH